MRNINLKSSLFLLLIISAIVFFVLVWIDGTNQLDIVTVFFKLIPKVVSIDLILISIFSKYMWKWVIFRTWLVPFPNLNGTWKGDIQTSWIDPQTGKSPAPIPAIVTIKQTFLKISCVMRTAEMTSHSVSSDFFLDEENQIKRLVYTYDSNPLQTIQDRSPQHCGTMVFNIIDGNKKQRKLEGGYWTGRKTTGHISMEFWKKKLIYSYPTELGEHPVTEIRK